MEYSIGDVVVYGGNGVCKVSAVEMKDLFGTGSEEYYVLSPLFLKQASTLYVPLGNERLVSKIKPIMSKTQADELIGNGASVSVEWIDDKNVRKNTYAQIINNGTPEEILGVILLMIRHRRNLEEMGKKLNIQDEKVFLDAKKRIDFELAAIYNILPENISKVIDYEAIA